MWVREGWIAYWNFYKGTRLCKLLRQATKITRLYEYGCVYYLKLFEIVVDQMQRLSLY